MKWSLKLIFFGLALLAISMSSCTSQKRAQKHRNKATVQTTETNNKKKTEHALIEKYAVELGVSSNDLKNEKLYQFIEDWKGVPYKYGGNSKVGVDCSGFIGQLYREVYTINLPRTTSEISQVSKPISKPNLSEGDIVIFDINGKKSSHVGVYLINGKFVHASTSRGVVISDLTNPYYQKAFSRGGKI